VVEEEERTEVARFGAGKPTRTIISGTDQLRYSYSIPYCREDILYRARQIISICSSLVSFEPTLL
jgi:hypothetical protein